MPELAKKLETTVNERLRQVAPSAIREFDDRVSQIPDIIKLSLGEPDQNVPEHVKQAAIASIVANDSHYSAQKGSLPLRQAISQYLQRKQNLNYDANNEIVVTIGATEAITSTLFSLLNAGDEVIVPTPSYALYFPIIELTGAKIVMVDTSQTDFVLTPAALSEALEQHPRTRLIILNYPTNPTGREYSQAEVTALAQIIEKYPVYVLSDEIYSELVYDQPHFSIARLLPEQTILISGVSKSHAMTGYRIGYLAAPHATVTEITKMHAFMVTAPTNSSQAAATEALNNGDADPQASVQIYRKRRDFIQRRLNEIGFETVSP
ncbi:MAG: aminotransferase class I/II-fold pyridoxal phosphate-dependent enzyme, partial [Bombilactobacillus mellifer]|uniref:aminotransferase class I/II-fold pyridoxal phosphate-dependent enzyme n=1 Tax=Bombilactobacillus mellifer TaxID=1218492 RepID=UPI0023F9F34C